MANIKIATDSDGAGAYQLPINPIEVEFFAEGLYEMKQIMDGPPVKQKNTTDSRVRALIWKGIRPDATPGWADQETVLASHVDTVKYINDYPTFGSGSLFSSGANSYIQIRVTDFKRTWDSGGVIKYSEVRYEFVVIDSNFTSF